MRVTSNKRVSDLPHVTCGHTVLILGPENKRQVSTARTQRELDEGLYKNLAGLQGLSHYGNLLYSPSSDDPGPYSYNDCGGKVTLTGDFPLECGAYSWARGCGETLMVCEACESAFVARPDPLGLGRLVHHLLRKQLWPDLKIANFIDCGKTKAWPHPLQLEAMRGEKLAAVQALGLIAVEVDALFGGFGDEVTSGRICLGISAGSGFDTQACMPRVLTTWASVVTKRQQKLERSALEETRHGLAQAWENGPSGHLERSKQLLNDLAGVLLGPKPYQS